MSLGQDEKDDLLCNSTWVQYELGNITSNRIIFAGLFPPANATPTNMYTNATSQRIMGVLGHRQFEWIDIYCYSPNIKSADMPENNLQQFLSKREIYRQDWWTRIHRRIQAVVRDGFLPIVFVCGQICQCEWQKLHLFHSQNQLGIEQIIVGGKYIPVIRGIHPSYVLQSHGHPEAVATFQREMGMLRLLSTTGNLDRIPPNILAEIDYEDADRQSKAVNACGMLFHRQHWPPEFETMKMLPWNSPKLGHRIWILIQRLRIPIGSKKSKWRWQGQLYDDTQWHQLFQWGHFTRWVIQDIFWDNVQVLFRKRNVKECLYLFSHETFCSQCTDPNFIQVLQRYVWENTMINLCQQQSLLATDGFIRNIGNPTFQELWMTWSKEWDASLVVRLFTTNSFANRICNISFRALFQQHLQQKDLATVVNLYSTGSYCVGLTTLCYRKHLHEYIPTEWQDRLCRVSSFNTLLYESPEELEIAISKLKELFPEAKSDIYSFFQTNVFCAIVRDPTRSPQLWNGLQNCCIKFGIPKTWTLFHTTSVLQQQSDKYIDSLLKLVSEYPNIAQIIIQLPGVLKFISDPEFVIYFDKDVKAYDIISLKRLYRDNNYGKHRKTIEYYLEDLKRMNLWKWTGETLIELLANVQFIEKVLTPTGNHQIHQYVREQLTYWRKVCGPNKEDGEKLVRLLQCKRFCTLAFDVKNKDELPRMMQNWRNHNVPLRYCLGQLSCSPAVYPWQSNYNQTQRICTELAKLHQNEEVAMDLLSHGGFAMRYFNSELFRKAYKQNYDKWQGNEGIVFQSLLHLDIFSYKLWSSPTVNDSDEFDAGVDIFCKARDHGWLDKFKAKYELFDKQKANMKSVDNFTILLSQNRLAPFFNLP